VVLPREVQRIPFPRELDAYHVLVRLGGLEDLDAADHPLEGRDEVAEFDYLHVRRHKRAAKVLRLQLPQPLEAVQGLDQHVASRDVVQGVPRPELDQLPLGLEVGRFSHLTPLFFF